MQMMMHLRIMIKKIDFQQTNKHGFARKKILEILVIVQKSME